MIWTIIVIILVIWLAGFILEIAGGFIHLLLVVALAVFIFNMLTQGKR